MFCFPHIFKSTEIIATTDLVASPKLFVSNTFTDPVRVGSPQPSPNLTAWLHMTSTL